MHYLGWLQWLTVWRFEKEITASVTERGQVTFPAEVRRVLGLKARDKVDFVVEGDTVRLRRPKFTIETAFGVAQACDSARWARGLGGAHSGSQGLEGGRD